MKVQIIDEYKEGDHGRITYLIKWNSRMFGEYDLVRKVYFKGKITDQQTMGFNQKGYENLIESFQE